MNRVIVDVEGQTEQTFIREVLAPWLAAEGIFLTARLIGKPGHKGGVGEYQRAKRELLILLEQESNSRITTMFDFYGMPDSWPGRKEAKSLPHDQKAPKVETALAQDIVKSLPNIDPKRFIPYVQMYEFEALLFTRPAVIGEISGNKKIIPVLQKVRDNVQTPEHINDGPETAPSKQIISQFKGYNKVLYGSIAAKRISVKDIVACCPHFRYWIEQLCVK